MKVNVCVIGAGVVGLSTAVQLTELRLPGVDIHVTLIAEKFSPETTGDGAAGIWDPHLCGVSSKANNPCPKVMKWTSETFAHNVGLARSADANVAGATMISGCSYFRQKMPELPYWKNTAFNFKVLSENDISRHPNCREMQLRDGYSHQTVTVDCIKYLPWLLKRFLRNGGSVQQRRISRIKELAGGYHVIVNCTGIGARDLVPDPMTRAIRGQTVCVEAPWIKHFTLIDNLGQHEDELLYIIPKCVKNDSLNPQGLQITRATYVVLGGTHDLDKYDRIPDADQKERIVRDCAKLEPALKGAKILRDWVGLRPSRFEVRVERELMSTEHGKLHVVHNYGHSGSGITMHWGCATEATGLVQQCVMELASKL